MNAKEYAIKNYNKYGIKDITCEKDMIALLNILEAHGETLDDLHDTSFGDVFCDIFFNYDGTDDNTIYNALLDHNIFYTSKTALIEELRESYEEYDETTTLNDDDFLKFIDEECNDDKITKTSDGYVRTIYY